MKAALILLSLILVGCDLKSPFSPARYQMVVTPASPNHEDKVWILDTDTGRVSLCYETAARIGCLEPSIRFPN